MNKEIEDALKDLNIVVLMRFGSHLYGTSTPESDEDYMGVFIPTAEQILLGTIPDFIDLDSKKSKKVGEKNTKDDIDCKIYSLGYFFKLCLKGETVALDMIHANEESILINTLAWGYVQENRDKIYTRRLNALVSYCHKQAAKYGIKGSRIADARRVQTFLDNLHSHYGDTKLGDYWKSLPTGEHIKFVMGGRDQTEEFYEVCGKKFGKSVYLGYCNAILGRFIVSYGARALQAEKNEGIDWKAVSHAIRFAIQIKSILTEGDELVFPLPQAEFIRAVKEGKYHYKNIVAPTLENLLTEVDELAENSLLPDKPNREFFDFLLYCVHLNVVRNAREKTYEN